nr:hypothetical protein Iba_chr02dCG2330 [Ipomoea batatas]
MLIDLEALKPFGLDETMDRLVIVPEWRHLLFDFKEDILISILTGSMRYLEVANKCLAETSKLLEVAKVSYRKIIATWEVERKKHAEELVRVVSPNKGDPEARGRRLSVQVEEGRVETNADAGLSHVSPLATTSSHVGGNLHEHPDDVPTPCLEDIHILDDKADLKQQA